MKKLHLIIILLLNCFYSLFAQIVITDNQFADAIKKQCPACIDYKNQLLSPAIFLKKLDVRTSEIHNLSGLEGFINLDTFDCSFNPLRQLPDKLPMGLKMLTCTNDSLIQLPPILPPMLKILDCSFNNLTKLPDLLVSLEKLKCMNNALEALPRQMPNLTYLNCSNNKIKEIENNVSRNLDTLDCSNNVLKTIKAVSQNLKYFNCRLNQLTVAPLLPYYTTYFDCSNNKITMVEGFSDSLKVFMCSDNLITELPELPKGLRILACNNNLIFHISRLPLSLKKLDCRGNLFTKTPKLPFNLDELLCSNNSNLGCFTNLPDSVKTDTTLSICPRTIYEKVQIPANRVVKDHLVNLVPYRKKDKWGYATFEGDVIIEPLFDSIQLFKTRNECKMPFAVVNIGNKKGLLDDMGDYVLDPEYDDIQCSEKWGFIAKKEKTGNWFYLSPDGLLVEDFANDINPNNPEISENIGKAKMEDDAILKNIQPRIFYTGQKASFSKRIKISDSYWQMTDTIMPSKYDSLVFTTPYMDTIFAKIDTNWGVINTKQEIIHPFLYDNIVKQIYPYQQKDTLLNKLTRYSFVKAHKNKQGWGIVSSKDSVTIPFMFDSLDVAYLPSFVKPNDSLTQQKLFFKVQNQQNQWGIMDFNSKWVHFCQFSKIESDNKNGFALYDNDKLGFYNPRTGLTIEPRYKLIRFKTKGLLEVITDKGKLGYIDDFGNEFFEDQY